MRTLFAVIVFSTLFGSSAHALIAPWYLPVDRILNNICMVRSSRVFSSCVVVGKETVITTAHTFGDEAKADKPDHRITVYTKFGPALEVRTAPKFLDINNINVIEATQDNQTIKTDIVALHVPELRERAIPALAVNGLNISLSEDEALYMMSKNNNCEFHGVGRHLVEGSGWTNRPESHSVIAPKINALSLTNPLDFHGHGVMAAAGDSGGAYTCYNDQGEKVLMGIIAAGNSSVLISDESKEETLEDQILHSKALPLYDATVSKWLKKTLCEFENLGCER